MIIIDPNKRKPSLNSIIKNIQSTKYGDLIYSVQLTRQFLRISSSNPFKHNDEFYRYTDYLSKTPAHVIFFRKNGLFIFRDEDKELSKLNNFAFLFLIGWFRCIFEKPQVQEIGDIHIILHKAIKK